MKLISTAMLRHNSNFTRRFLSLLTLLTLEGVCVASGIICEPGEMATRLKTCVPCPANQYNPKKGLSKECRNCEPCGLYSFKILPCTPKSNTKCSCHDGFIPYDDSVKRCKCPSGSGIKISENGTPICRKCPPNSHSSQINSQCTPRYVETIPGNVTCDVNCGNAKTVVASSSILSYSQTPASASTMTSTTSRNSSTAISSSAASIPEHDGIWKHTSWLAFLIAFLLLLLILKLSRCPKKKTEIVRQGSACGKPVEESGEKFIPPL